MTAAGRRWPKFSVGGNLTDGNTDMIELLASFIAANGKALRLSQSFTASATGY